MDCTYNRSHIATVTTVVSTEICQNLKMADIMSQNKYLQLRLSLFEKSPIFSNIDRKKGFGQPIK